MPNRRALLGGILALPALAGARAADWPERPIRLVVPYPAGGGVDMTARLMTAALSAKLGQTIVVDNRAGAGSNIGAEYVARSAPDGYTAILSTNSTFVTNVSLYRHLTYDPVRGLSPVSLVALYPLILVVPNAMPVRNVADFIEYAKAHPDLPCGTSGAGSPQHLCGTVFGTRTGASFNYVHYRGGAPAVSDMLSGQLQVLFAPLPEALTHVQGGSFRALAVTGTTRSPLLPNVPTVAETLPGYDMPMWNAMFVPAGTPQPIIDRLSREVASVLQIPDVRQKFIEGAFEPVGNTPAELDQFRTAELPRWAEIVRDSGATLD